MGKQRATILLHLESKSKSGWIANYSVFIFGCGCLRKSKAPIHVSAWQSVDRLSGGLAWTILPRIRTSTFSDCCLVSTWHSNIITSFRTAYSESIKLLFHVFIRQPGADGYITYRAHCCRDLFRASLHATCTAVVVQAAGYLIQLDLWK